MRVVFQYTGFDCARVKAARAWCDLWVWLVCRKSEANNFHFFLSFSSSATRLPWNSRLKPIINGGFIVRLIVDIEVLRTGPFLLDTHMTPVFVSVVFNNVADYDTPWLFDRLTSRCLFP